MHKINLGIIGAGNIAQKHLEAIKDINEFNVLGITSRTFIKAKRLAKKFNIDRVYNNIEELIKENKIDAILILVSATEIFKITRKIIKCKIPFFVEKPPGILPEQTKKLFGLAKKYKTLNMVGYNRRYYSIFHKGINIINKNGKLLGLAIEGHERFWKIGNNFPKLLRNTWIFHMSPHTLDLIRFFGGEPKNLSVINKKYIEKRGDQFSAVMEFKSGAIGNYMSHWYSPGGWSVRLFGEGVTVEFKPLEKGKWINKNFKEYIIKPDNVDLKYKPGFYNQMKAFHKMIVTGKLVWPGQDLENAYKTTCLAKKFIN